MAVTVAFAEGALVPCGLGAVGSGLGRFAAAVAAAVSGVGIRPGMLAESVLVRPRQSVEFIIFGSVCALLIVPDGLADITTGVAFVVVVPKDDAARFVHAAADTPVLAAEIVVVKVYIIFPSIPIRIPAGIIRIIFPVLCD